MGYKLAGYDVVLYRFSTSNHNHRAHSPHTLKLYYIVSLHQTTTHQGLRRQAQSLYYIVSLHQTTTDYGMTRRDLSCIISFLYIKPQLFERHPLVSLGCIISFLYIKPQLRGGCLSRLRELYYIRQFGIRICLE